MLQNIDIVAFFAISQYFYSEIVSLKKDRSYAKESLSTLSVYCCLFILPALLLLV